MASYTAGALKYNQIYYPSKLAESGSQIFILLPKEKEKDSYGVRTYSGGEGGIRTLDELLTHTPLAGERLQPLGHLSKKLKRDCNGLALGCHGNHSVVLIDCGTFT